MKLIFLDFDGVLNSTQFFIMCENRYIEGSRADRDIEAMCPISMSNLNHIMDQCEDVRVVISSSWRVGRGIKELKRILAKNGFKHEDKVIGKTPHRGVLNCRGEEIQDWIDKKFVKIDDFVILDDDEDMGKLKSHLYKTNPKHGLGLEIAQQIIKRFGGKNEYFDV
jgi:hypothetical protein